jgi:threonylcarbamoyladenosine tRNA methylthiotransferase CDKAL1
VSDPAIADLTVFYSCALTDAVVNDSLNTIKELQKKAKPDSQVIAWGCLPKIEPEPLKKIYQGPTFTESDIYRFDEIIHAVTPVDEITANEVCPRYQEPGREKVYTLPLRLHTLPLRLLDWFHDTLCKKENLYSTMDTSVFYIKTSTGCLGHCTYCSVRLSRGTIKSKPIDKIIGEFKEGLGRGYKNFALMGTDVGSFGRDLGYTLVDLLREIVKEKGDYRIGIRNLNPYFLNQMLDDLEPIFATGKIWLALIPTQSGSNRILKLMGRPYTVETLKETIRRLKRVCPDLKVRTQVMVGFPTETKQDFAESMQLLDEVKFDYVEVYRYSPRPGTPAAKMPCQIPYRVVLLREYRMKYKLALNAMPAMWKHGKLQHGKNIILRLATALGNCIGGLLSG